LRDYAVVGDGRTVALIASDGSVDWLAWPNLDSPSVFAAVVDADRGGNVTLAPTVPYQVSRAYLPATNVLRTRFTTADGVVEVTEPLTLSEPGALVPGRELVRRVDGISGAVPIEWRVRPRFEYGAHQPTIGFRSGVPVASHGGTAVAVRAWGVGEPECVAGTIGGRATITTGDQGLIALAYADGEPLVLPSRADCDARLDHTAEVWRRWTRRLTYAGPWRDAVVRSALALKLLVFAPS